ncbi:MAG: bis(5'-nucleosyl)-tetraphosphatase (symmetrical) YqeK [Dehalobacterium sp.]
MEINKEITMEEKFQPYIKILKDSMSSYRWEHSLSVAETAKELARFWGADLEKAWLAGILHDFAREFPEDQLIRLALEHGLSVLEAERANSVVLHAPVGAILVHEKFGIKDPEILSAIAKHTVGGISLTLLDKIIFLADMIEAGRNWPGVEKLRSMVYQDLDQTLKEALEGTIKFLKEKGRIIHPHTLATYSNLQDNDK